MRYDYMIAGGGPAGATAAYCLQKRGADCLIIDRKKQIGEKTCGGLLTWSGISALRGIGLDPGELLEDGAARIQSFVYTAADGGRTVHRYHAGEYGLGVSRKMLDRWLLKQAVGAGARFLPGMDLRQTTKEDGLFVTGDSAAKRLIVATGAAGYVPKGMEAVIKNQSFGLSAQITGRTSLRPDTVYFFMTGQNAYDYFWMIPNDNGVWNIGVWFQRVPGDAAACFRSYKASVADRYFEGISFVRPVRGAYCGNIDFSACLPPGCCAVGDAAGKNNGDTGEGLRYAIESAVSLSESLCMNGRG